MKKVWEIVKTTFFCVIVVAAMLAFPLAGRYVSVKMGYEHLFPPLF